MTAALRRFVAAAAAFVMCGLFVTASAAGGVPEKVVVDFDIGDDIDDAFALALVLASPEFEVLGISTAWGDTALRVRLVQRFLHETGHDAIPVARGLPTATTTLFSQARWAERWPASDVPTSIDFLLDVIARHPGEVTLIALGPMTNVAAALERDPTRFAKLRRIVVMGGSVRRGYGRKRYLPATPPAREYNVASDVAAARRVFASNVPIVLFPLDSTLVRLDDVRRDELFAHGSPTTDALTLLYHQWSNADTPWAGATPTLFDIVPIAALIDPSTCPLRPMRIVITDDGYTREEAGPPNVRVCLASDGERALDWLMRRLLTRQ